MNIDQSSIDRILALSDADLKRLASEIASAAGANRLKTEMMLSDLDRVRGMLSQLTPSDAQQLISSVGEEKSEEIAELLRERGVDVGR